MDRAAGRRSRETLLLAARAHHLRRWELPRDSYPVGRAGYLRWRRDQKAAPRHGRRRDLGSVWIRDEPRSNGCSG